MSRPAWGYYAGLYRDSRLSLLGCLSASILQSLALAPIALLVKYALDSAIPYGDQGALFIIGACILGLFTLHASLALWTRHICLRITKAVIKSLRHSLIAKLCDLPRETYTREKAGRLHTVIVQDSERLDVMSNALVAQLLPALLPLAVLCGILAHLSAGLFLILLAAAPPLYLLSRLLRARVASSVRRFHRAFEGFGERVLFTIRAMDLIRLRSQREREALDVPLEELRASSAAMAWLQAAYQQGQMLLMAFVIVLILVVGGEFVASGRMSVGALVSFYVGLGLLRGHFQTIATTLPQIIAGNESLSTLHELLTRREFQPYRGRSPIAFSGGITLDSVHFRYEENRALLEGVDLEIEPGETVAIIGASGAGKTTLINMILGFYRPGEGQLLADGRRYDDLDMCALRREIGVVPHSPLIFPATIAENIRYGQQDVPDEEMIASARAATAHDFISSLSAGYDTWVGEDGITLTGGQRQRIALARCLLGDPKLLILDEPGSHLDAASLGELLLSLAVLSPKPAMLVVSHDNAVLSGADRVLELVEGSLYEAGWDALSRRRTAVAATAGFEKVGA
jgi:ABC-type multidrug transport system fused ATPase/permease subunit